MLNENVGSELESTILKATEKFTASTSQLLANMFQNKATHVSPAAVLTNPDLPGSLHFSILFTGVVYGEYIFSLERETCQNLAQSIDPHLVDSEETFNESVIPVVAEALNIIVGDAITELNSKFEKLTICPPKVHHGKVCYPSYVSGQSLIACPAGDISLTFFFDQTKTELTVSYRNTVKSLLAVNKELEIANLRLKEQQAKLVHSEKMASLGTMAAGVAHEINNPLSFVDSNFSTLESYMAVIRNVMTCVQNIFTALDSQEKAIAAQRTLELKSLGEEENLSHVFEDTQALIQESKDGIGRIRDIVRGLKDFSHVDQPEMTKANLNEEIESVLKMVSSQLKYSCKIEKHLGDIPEILCFPRQLNQVFFNLLVNASHAIAGTEKPGTIKILTETTNDNVRVEIEDTGPGIAPEVIHKIFDPFFTTKPIGKGTGLGLYICHAIVLEHKGSLEVKSKPGEGTRFTITIPNNLLNETYDSGRHPKPNP